MSSPSTNKSTKGTNKLHRLDKWEDSWRTNETYFRRIHEGKTTSKRRINQDEGNRKKTRVNIRNPALIENLSRLSQSQRETWPTSASDEVSPPLCLDLSPRPKPHLSERSRSHLALPKDWEVIMDEAKEPTTSLTPQRDSEPSHFHSFGKVLIASISKNHTRNHSMYLDTACGKVQTAKR